MIDFPSHKNLIHARACVILGKLDKNRPAYSQDWRSLALEIKKILDDPKVKAGRCPEALNFLRELIELMRAANESDYEEMSPGGIIFQIHTEVWLPLWAKGQTARDEWLDGWTVAVCRWVEAVARAEKPQLVGHLTVYRGGRS